MPYTEFRKSYGDFEIVIPAVMFELTQEQARATVKALRSYKIGFVCDSLLKQDHAVEATLSIGNMLNCWADSSGLGTAIKRAFDDEYNKLMPYFGIRHQSGITLRKAWCEHMANEIEREFGLTL